MDREENNKQKYPFMMDQEEIQEIIQKEGMMHNVKPYQYKLNRNKRVVAKRESLESDE